MLVSIVIPMYNAEKYVEECIESALDQTYDDIEIIVVNDGSTDNSLKIIEKFGNKIIVVNKDNGGTSSALNEGIKIMSGKWVKWLSADDVLNNNCIKVLMNEVKKLSNYGKNCILYSNYDYIDENSKIVGEYIEPNYNELEDFDRNVILLDHFFGNGSTCLINKFIFDRLGLFDEKIGFQEDYEFWLRCCLLNNITLHLVPQKLAKYRLHKQQLTQKKLAENILHAETIRKKIIDQLEPNIRKKYLASLKKLQKQKNLKIRIRHKIRNIMLKTLPKNISYKVLQMYTDRKKY